MIVWGIVGAILFLVVLLSVLFIVVSQYWKTVRRALLNGHGRIGVTTLRAAEAESGKAIFIGTALNFKGRRQQPNTIFSIY